jgi:hypothetical protein
VWLKKEREGQVEKKGVQIWLRGSFSDVRCLRTILYLTNNNNNS